MATIYSFKSQLVGLRLTILVKVLFLLFHLAEIASEFIAGLPMSYESFLAFLVLSATLFMSFLIIYGVYLLVKIVYNSFFYFVIDGKSALYPSFILSLFLSFSFFPHFIQMAIHFTFSWFKLQLDIVSRFLKCAGQGGEENLAGWSTSECSLVVRDFNLTEIFDKIKPIEPISVHLGGIKIYSISNFAVDLVLFSLLFFILYMMSVFVFKSLSSGRVWLKSPDLQKDLIAKSIFGLVVFIGFFFTLTSILSVSLLREFEGVADREKQRIANSNGRPISNFSAFSRLDLNLWAPKPVTINNDQLNSVFNKIENYLVHILFSKTNQTMSEEDVNERINSFVKSNILLTKSFNDFQNKQKSLSDVLPMNRLKIDAQWFLLNQHINDYVEAVRAGKLGAKELAEFDFAMERWGVSVGNLFLETAHRCGLATSNALQEVERKYPAYFAIYEDFNEVKSYIDGIDLDKINDDYSKVSKFLERYDEIISRDLRDIFEKYDAVSQNGWCAVNFDAILSSIPKRPTMGDFLGPIGPLVRWLLPSETKEPVIIIGLIGVSLLGASLGRVIRKQIDASRCENCPMSGVGAAQINLAFEDSFIVISSGVAAAIVVFLASYGGLSILQEGAVQGDPNTYVLLVVCLVAAAFSEDVWRKAKAKFIDDTPRSPEPRPAPSSQSQSTQTAAQAETQKANEVKTDGAELTTEEIKTEPGPASKGKSAENASDKPGS